MIRLLAIGFWLFCNDLFTEFRRPFLAIEPIIRQTFPFPQSVENRQSGPDERGNADDGQKQRSEDQRLHCMTIFVKQHFVLVFLTHGDGIACRFLVGQEDKHAAAKAVQSIPIGHYRCSETSMRLSETNKKNDETQQVLRQSPSPLDQRGKQDGGFRDEGGIFHSESIFRGKDTI